MCALLHAEWLSLQFIQSKNSFYFDEHPFNFNYNEKIEIISVKSLNVLPLSLWVSSQYSGPQTVGCRPGVAQSWLG